MTDPSSRARSLAAAALRLAALWLLAGALFKLLEGSPKDLPEVVRALGKKAGLALGTTYRLVITVELCLGTLAILRPRAGWLPLVAQYLVFLGILGLLVLGGEASCGCFGSDFPIPPWGMLLIDGALLAAMLKPRPWATLRPGGASWRVIAVLWVVALAAPVVLDREVDLTGPTTALAPDGVEGGDPTTGETPDAGWLLLDVEDWVDEDLGDTPIARWVDPYAFPPDARWVLWRQTCDHCAAHLAHLADTDTGEEMLVLLRLEEEHDTESNRVVSRLPEGPHVFQASLPDTVEYVVTTPADLWVEEWKVVRAEEGVEVDEH